MNVGRKDNEEAEFPGRCGGAVAGNDDRQGHRHVLQNPLNRLIGEANYGYFTTAYDIYTVLLMISTTGLPVAMSRMISEARALNNGKQVRQIYRVSLMAFLSIGIIGSALMLIIPKQLANMMENPNAMWSIFALGPARALRVLHLRLPRLLPGAGEHGSYGRQPRSSRRCASSSLASALPGSS